METGFVDNKKKFSWSDLLIGILYILAAITFFSRPVLALGTLVIWFGVLAIIKGILNFVAYSKIRKTTGAKATALIVAGVLNIIIGIILLFNIPTGAFVVGYLFALWFITDSISHVLNAGYLKEKSKFAYWTSIILNVFCAFVGFSLFFNPIVSALTVPILVGVYFMLFGIERIIAAF